MKLAAPQFALSRTEFFASPENRLRDVVIPYLPGWLFLNIADPRDYQIYTGLGSAGVSGTTVLVLSAPSLAGQGDGDPV